VTCLLLGIFLLWILVTRPEWTARLWLAFSILTIPFVLTNGVLTGITFWEYPFINTSPAAIADQIVWYNNAHNLGVRLFSIPLDDFLYGFLLIGLNVACFEYLAGRRGHRQPGDASP
jgi:hypothetical protein